MQQDVLRTQLEFSMLPDRLAAEGRTEAGIIGGHEPQLRVGDREHSEAEEGDTVKIGINLTLHTAITHKVLLFLRGGKSKQ
jgi:hypothetical protein